MSGVRELSSIYHTRALNPWGNPYPRDPRSTPTPTCQKPLPLTRVGVRVENFYPGVIPVTLYSQLTCVEGHKEGHTFFGKLHGAFRHWLT